MKSLFKFLQLPTPKELGWSEYNGLGSRDLTPFQEGKTWEDWDEYCKENHPIKYFLMDTVPGFFRPIGYKLSRSWYWLKCKTLPSHRFHLIDLRGVDPLSNYSYGYMDQCEVMKLTAWASLRVYIEKEEPADPASFASPEEMADPWLIDQKLKRYDEPVALYKYWMEERAAEQKEEARLFALCKVEKKAALEAKDKEAYDAASKAWLDYHRACEAREQEMYMRLCAIREYLWT